MPPVNKAGGSAFRKDVEFVTKDEDEQVAAGIVMVPDKADLQNDFAREGTIREFADQFEAFEEAGQAGGGIMHAVWPDGWMDLERNEVLDEAEEIGGRTVDAGAWVQEWSIENDQLWGLIDDAILEGYSIGAIQVGWGGPYEQGDEEVDDVDTSEIPDDELVWELTDGLIREVSAVDIPAVPDAEILEAKAMEKRLGDHVGDPEAFLEEAMDRGHSEEEAERLWDVLNEATDVDGAGEPGKESFLERIGKAAVNAFLGSDDDDRSEALDRGADVAETSETDPHSDKEGRTLSRQNRESLYATIDASLDVLEDAGVNHGMTRFTDRDDTSFDLSEHSAREWPDDEDDDEDEDSVGTDGPPFESAAGGDTPADDDGGTEAAENMTQDDTTDTDDPWADAPEWAKDLRDGQDENSKRIEEVADDGEEKSDDPFDDAPEWAKDLKQQQEKNAERIDAISKQTGTDSQQLGKAEEEVENEKGSDFTLDPRKAR